jgi:thioredoxin-like negative regulator of GroEL
MVAAALTTATVLNSTAGFAQELPKSPNQAKPIDPSDPNVLRPVDQENNILSMPGGQRLMQEAKQAASSQNYTLAIKKYQEARQVYNQLSNFYQDLAGSFSGIDNRISDTQRKKALETAQLRDEATYQLALVHRAQNQPELAVPLLVQIVRSQQPTRDLGQRAYQQLLELGFVEAPFPRSRAEQPNSTPSRQ